MSFINFLKNRNLIYQSTHEKELDQKLESGDICCYLGIDLTADSMHIGHLLPLRLLTLFSDKAVKSIMLFGRGTTMIGDPSMRTSERPMLSSDAIMSNMEGIKNQAQAIMPNIIFEDNADWLLSLNLIEFLREVGTKFSVNQLVSLETFKNRLQNNISLSFLEFTYPMMQSYDFYKLNQKHKCNLQIGGSDQWGNITSGINFMKKHANEDSYGITVPLLLVGGQKMGKSTGKPIWLNETKTSVFDFWQFWRNLPDQDVETYMLRFTNLSHDEILDLLQNSINDAKKLLADTITTWVHGKEKCIAAKEKSESIFEKQDYSEIDTFTVDNSNNIKLTSLLVQIGFATSSSDAKRKTRNNGIYINDQICSDETMILTKESHQHSIIGHGKKYKKKINFS